jgi:hypothetical protein
MHVHAKTTVNSMCPHCGQDNSRKQCRHYVGKIYFLLPESRLHLEREYITQGEYVFIREA